MPIFRLKFYKRVSDFKEAGIAFRVAVGDIPSLRNSFLGYTPLLMVSDDEALKKHRKIRQFKNVEELKVFLEYLEILILNSPSPHPTIAIIGENFRYVLASGRAKISFQKAENSDVAFTICGEALFKDPNIAKKTLQSDGFEVEIEKISDDENP